jgi:hypothetical protein
MCLLRGNDLIVNHNTDYCSLITRQTQILCCSETHYEGQAGQMSQWGIEALCQDGRGDFQLQSVLDLIHSFFSFA